MIVHFSFFTFLSFGQKKTIGPVCRDKIGYHPFGSRQGNEFFLFTRLFGWIILFCTCLYLGIITVAGVRICQNRYLS